MARTLKSQLLITYRQTTSHYAHTTWVPIPQTGNNITTTMYRRKLHSSSEMRYLVNRTAIHVLSQNHRIRDKMLHCMHITCRHVHRQAGANCTDAKLYFWTFFQFFFIIQMGPGPTHPLPNYFWIFGIFLTLQSPLVAWWWPYQW